MLGSSAIALQSMFIAMVIAYIGEATSVNVVYSLRGLWSVLVITFFGAYFDNTEGDMPLKYKVYRIAGAIVMTIAVLLVFI